jgi:hypothetical protein
VSNTFIVDLENKAGVKYGSGPVATANTWQHTKRLDRAGTVSFDMPAIDPRVLEVVARRIVHCYGERDGAPVDMGTGIIETLTINPDEEKATVTGSDLLSELAGPSVHNLALNDGASGPMAAASVLGAVMASAPSTWSFTGTPSQGVYQEFAGESVLAALSKIAELTGDHFRLGAGRQVVWLPKTTPATYPASGLVAVGGGDPVELANNPLVCIIDDLEIVEDGTEIITRIYPFGAGNAEARLTIANTTRFGAPGTATPADHTVGEYTLHIDATPALSYIKYNPGEATADDRIERHVSFKDVTAAEPNTSTDQISAADMLFDQALEHLKAHQAPATSYRLSLLALDQEIIVGTTIRVSWHDFVDGWQWLDIEADLLVLETTTQIDAAGVHTVGLLVSVVARWPTGNRNAPAVLKTGDVQTIVNAVKQLQSMDAHRQEAAIAQEARNYSGGMTGFNIAPGRTLTIAENTTINGGGTINMGGFTTTIPAAGTVAILETANTFALTGALTTGIVGPVVLQHLSSATPAAGFGLQTTMAAHSDTNTVRTQGQIRTEWVDATDATRKAKMELSVTDTARRLFLAGEASGTAAKIGFLGATPVVRPTVTGAKGGNAALTSFIAAAVALGLITDTTT